MTVGSPKVTQSPCYWHRAGRSNRLGEMQRGEEEKVKNGDEVRFPRLREKYRSDPGSLYERCAFQEDVLHILMHILPISHPEFEPLIYIRQIKMPIYIFPL